MTTRAPAAYRYHPLGGFRLFLAGLVVAQHLIANVAPLGRAYDVILPYEVGSVAVLVFFALSGFVISEAATLVYPGKPLPFLANRILRIMPHFVVALAIAVVVHAVFHHLGTLRLSDRESSTISNEHAFSLLNIATNLFGFLPGVNRLEAFDFVDTVWAVRIEMLFYGAVALALAVPSRAVLLTLTPYALLALGLATYFVHYKVGYSFFFLYGVLLHQRCNPQRRGTQPACRTVSLLFSVLGMALYVVLVPLQTQAGYHRAMVAQAVLLTFLIGLMTVLARASIGRNRLDQQCGDLSYPLYIHHQNALVLVLSLGSGYSYAFVGIAAILAIVVSYGLMRAVDPAISRLRNLVRGQQVRPEAPVIQDLAAEPL